MPAADRSLEHNISAERIAGVDIYKIRHFANGIGKALLHLHRDKGLVHADFSRATSSACTVKGSSLTSTLLSKYV
jgi:hypothetical protein